MVYDITGITKEGFDAVKAWEIDTSESRSLQQTGGAVRRVGDTLFFQAANRRVMLISDRDANEDNDPGEEFVSIPIMVRCPDRATGVLGPNTVKWKDNRNLLIEKIERNQESPRYIRLTARP